jgi:hypothetical protein
MDRRSTLARLLILVLLLAVLPFSAAPALAAEPGEELINSSGSIPAGQAMTMTLYSTGAANLRLEVGGGAAGDKVALSLLAGSSTVRSWDVQSGEIAWATVDLPANGRLSLRNTSGTPLTYKLVAYATGVIPSVASGVGTWSGTARGDGIHSQIRISAPKAGLYRFTLGASGGSFQVQADANYLLKTVVPSNGPNPSDSVYYLTAGTHTLTIVQSPAALTTWSVALAAAGTLDALPSSESSAALGGNSFKEEWIPLQVAGAAQVNLKITVNGAASDFLTVAVYNNSRATAVFSSTAIYAGETFWANSALAAGANAIRVVAGGGGSVGYTITVLPIAQAPATLSGTSYGGPAHPSGGNSRALLTFPKAGLYRFTLGASAGRYQLHLNDPYLQKTVSTAGATFTAYVPAGTFPLLVVQDPAAASTSWSVAVALASESADSLPYVRGGGGLGGASNAFVEEWLPIQSSSGALVNLKLTASGAASDWLRVELYKAGGSQPVYTLAKVYGGEVLWGTSALAGGGNLLHIVAPAGNSGALSYQVEVRAVDTIPGAWSGTSASAGLNSVLSVNAPVAGTYNITVSISAGSGQLLVDRAAGAGAALRGVRIASTTTVLRVPLSAGRHTFTFQQDPAQSPTVWQVAAGLRSADSTGGGGNGGGANLEPRAYIPLSRR